MILERAIENRDYLAKLLAEAHPDIRIAPHADTNIICFCLAKDGELLSQSNESSEALYDAFSTRGERPFYFSKTSLKWPAYTEYLNEFISSWGGKRNCDALVLVRMCLMNPFFGSKQTNLRYPESLVEQIKSYLGC